MFRNKVGGEEEERRHLLLDAEFIQKLLFTARTKTSIELLISSSLDSLNKWKKRDLEEALIPNLCGNSLSSGTFRENQTRFSNCQSSTARWAVFLVDVHTVSRLPAKVHRIDLPPATHSGTSRCGLPASCQLPKPPHGICHKILMLQI